MWIVSELVTVRAGTSFCVSVRLSVQRVLPTATGWSSAAPLGMEGRRVSSGRQAKWLAEKEGFGNWPKHAQQWPATENMAHGLETDGALQNEEPGQWMKGNCRGVGGGHCWYYLTPCSLVLLVGLMKYVTLHNTRTLISVNATVWRNKYGHILSRKNKVILRSFKPSGTFRRFDCLPKF
jgi:hypothetical protein